MTDEDKRLLGMRAAKLWPELFHRQCRLKSCPNLSIKCVDCRYYKHYPPEINWDNAVRLRDEMCNSRIWSNACYEIWESYTKKAVTQEVFWRDRALPGHYILAACKAKEKENGQ